MDWPAEACKQSADPGPSRRGREDSGDGPAIGDRTHEKTHGQSCDRAWAGQPPATANSRVTIVVSAGRMDGFEPKGRTKKPTAGACRPWATCWSTRQHVCVALASAGARPGLEPVRQSLVRPPARPVLESPAMSGFRPRRPLSFSLRTLMLLVGVACILAAWLAAQWRFVLERRAVRQSWEGDAEVVMVMPSAVLIGAERDIGLRPDRPAATIPRIRTLLGDEALSQIWFRGADHAKVERAMRWFPEASISNDGTLIVDRPP